MTDTSPRPSDEELLEQAQAGNISTNELIERLRKRYGDLLTRYATRLRLQDVDAEDAVNTTYEVVVTHFKDFKTQGPGCVRGWLFEIHRRRCLGVMTDRWRRAEKERRLPSEITQPPNAKDGDPAQSVEASDWADYLQAMIEDCLSQLHSGQVYVIVRRHAGEKLRSIARSLRLADSTVHERYARGLAKLRSCLEKKGVYYESS